MSSVAIQPSSEYRVQYRLLHFLGRRSVWKLLYNFRRGWLWSRKVVGPEEARKAAGQPAAQLMNEIASSPIVVNTKVMSEAAAINNNMADRKQATVTRSGVSKGTWLLRFERLQHLLGAATWDRCRCSHKQMGTVMDEIVLRNRKTPIVALVFCS